MERRKKPLADASWCSRHGCLFPETLRQWDYHVDPLIEHEEPCLENGNWEEDDFGFGR